jgi:pimeloyl-ACP methyl ester carboxylesterase
MNTRNGCLTRVSKVSASAGEDRTAHARPATFPRGLRQPAHARHRSRLKTLQAPTLIVWGTDDVYFDVKWSRWLADTIPGARRRVELQGARIFFPEERWAEFDRELRAHWLAAQEDANGGSESQG